MVGYFVCCLYLDRLCREEHESYHAAIFGQKFFEFKLIAKEENKVILITLSLIFITYSTQKFLFLVNE